MKILLCAVSLAPVHFVHRVHFLQIPEEYNGLRVLSHSFQASSACLYSENRWRNAGYFGGGRLACRLCFMSAKESKLRAYIRKTQGNHIKLAALLDFAELWRVTIPCFREL